MQRIGIVTGMQAELDAFRPDRPGDTVEGPIAVRTLEHGGKACFLACAGIGKVASASAAARLAHVHRVDLLLVIGTAARIGLGPGGAHRIAEALQVDYGARSETRFARYEPGTIPFGPEPVLSPYRALALPGIDLPAARIASSDMFVESAVHAEELGTALGATLIDMETAAVAQAAGLAGIPWAAIKAATDAADEDSASSFLEHLARAARAAALEAEKAIAAL